MNLAVLLARSAKTGEGGIRKDYSGELRPVMSKFAPGDMVWDNHLTGGK